MLPCKVLELNSDKTTQFGISRDTQGLVRMKRPLFDWSPHLETITFWLNASATPRHSCRHARPVPWLPQCPTISSPRRDAASTR